MCEIDDVLEPLDSLTGLLGTLSCVDSKALLLNADDLSMTFIHLSMLSHETQEKLVALGLELENDTPKGREESVKKPRKSKKAA